MDSCVTAAVANEDADGLAFLHVSYGQRTEDRERRAFEEIADHYTVKQAWLFRWNIWPPNWRFIVN